MRKIIFILFFFTSILYRAQAECPEGWETKTVTAQYSYNYNGYSFSCFFTIKYCCRWNNDLKTVELIIDEIYPTYSSICWLFIRNWYHFNDWVHNTVAESSVNCNPPYPPCDDPINFYYDIRLVAYYCWYFENWEKYIGDDYILSKKRCQNQTNYCEKTWRVCIDYSYNPPRIIRTFISSISYGQPQCPTNMPELPPEGDPRWGQHWITSCFAEPCE